MALPSQEDTLCTLICLSKATEKHSKEYVSMADIQTAAAEVHSTPSLPFSLTCQPADIHVRMRIFAAFR